MRGGEGGEGGFRLIGKRNGRSLAICFSQFEHVGRLPLLLISIGANIAKRRWGWDTGQYSEQICNYPINYLPSLNVT